MEEQYNKYRQIVIKITKDSDKAEDLLHDVLLQLDKNEKYKALPIKEQTYFFVRAIQNQFYSNNSLFQRTYNKYKYQEFNTELQVKEELYQETPSMEWLNETLDKELETNKNFWYNYGLFKMYMEHKKIEPIHLKTRIPRYSIRNTINEMKLWVKQKWLEYQDGTD
jgi:hypothetical protein